MKSCQKFQSLKQRFRIAQPVGHGQVELVVVAIKSYSTTK